MAGDRPRHPGGRLRGDPPARHPTRAGHAHAEQPRRHPLARRHAPMNLPPPIRKTVLVTHVGTSVGWLGALTGYLALDITAAVSTDIATVRGAYVGMGVLVEYAIVPTALTSVLVGIINALGTPWGLFRHYWVLVKLILTLFAAGVLLHEAGPVGYLANLATSSSDPRQLSSTLPHSIGGM